MSHRGDRRSSGPADARSIVDALNRHGVEYVVIGGYAVRAHGYPRVTEDLDISPRRDPRNYARLARALAELDRSFSLPSGRSPQEVGEIDFGLGRVARFRTDYGVLDVVLEPVGVPKGYEDLLPGSLEVEVGDLRIRIAGRDDVIRMKRALGRERDLEDVAAIEDAARPDAG